MSYLERRIKYLLEELRAGRFILQRGNMSEEIVEDLARIKKEPDGSIDLSTCTPLVRSLARTHYLTRHLTGGHSKETPSAREEASPKIDQVQREFFSLVEEFFYRATGSRTKKLSMSAGFRRLVQRKGEKIARLVPEAFRSFSKQLETFYKANPTHGYEASRHLGGAKLVLPSQRFPAAALHATRSMLLYADTVFIPDPILPWLERERKEERFALLYPLEYAFHLLQLKSLVDADLPHPAVVVFPSWEKTLESVDDETQDGLGRLILDFFSHYFRHRFEDESDVFAYAAAEEEQFLRVVDEGKLFFPPEGIGSESITEAIKLYKKMISEQRSKDYQEQMAEFSDGQLVANGILERLQVQYHVLENADSLSANPLMWLRPQWHYHSLCAQVREGELEEAALVGKETLATMHALTEPRFRWLGNIPLDALVELRKANENEDFREALGDGMRALHGAALDDVDRVAAEVGKAIASLLARHDREVERLEEEYRRRYGVTAAIGMMTLSAAFLPWLAPFVGPVSSPSVLAGLYARDKVEESRKKRQAARSLTGVLAAARKRSN